MKRVLWVPAVFLLLSCGLEAQVAGRISGYVKDPSGAALPGATVTAVSDEQQLKRTIQSDDTGFYNLLAMPPGVYEIAIETPGFERQMQTGVRLALGESLRLDVRSWQANSRRRGYYGRPGAPRRR